MIRGNHSVFLDMKLQECLYSCQRTKSFDCVSVNFNEASKECRKNSILSNSMDARWAYASGTKYYQLSLGGKKLF